MLAATAAALWVQPAAAVTFQTNPITPYDLTLTDTDQRWDFRVVGDLPQGGSISLPTFNEWFKFTTTWGASGLETDVNVDRDATEPFVTSTVLKSTPTAWSILYDWDESAIFDRCGTAPAVIGEVCATRFEIWANGSWFPYDVAPGFDETPATFELTMAPVPEPRTWALAILGIGLAGTAIRRRRAGASQGL